MKNKLLMLLITFITSSCFTTKLDTPEALLQHYVYLAFSGAEDRELEKHFTPNFLQMIREEQKNNSPGAREISYKNLKLKNYKVLNKICEKADTCQIRFELDYEEKNSENGEVAFRSGTKKIAVLKETSNKEWQIDDISHLRTQHEIKEEIQVPSKP